MTLFSSQPDPHPACTRCKGELICMPELDVRLLGTDMRPQGRSAPACGPPRGTQPRTAPDTALPLLLAVPGHAPPNGGEARKGLGGPTGNAPGRGAVVAPHFLDDASRVLSQLAAVRAVADLGRGGTCQCGARRERTRVRAGCRAGPLRGVPAVGPRSCRCHRRVWFEKTGLYLYAREGVTPGP